MYRAAVRHLYQIPRTRIDVTPDHHMRLHRLERPEPWDEEFRRILWSDLPANLSNYYPDYSSFYQRVALFAGVNSKELVVGAGIEDFIRSLILLTCEPGEIVAFTHPTCAMFDIHCQIARAVARPVYTNPDYPLGVAELCSYIEQGVRLLLLPNPGQPVESYFDLADLRVIADACKRVGAILAIDEAYWGFGAKTALPLIREFFNVIILRTFSKAFGGASLRVGYAMGVHQVIYPLEASRLSGEVAGPSMLVATRLMDNWDRVEKGIAEVCAGRDWLREQLRADGFRATGRRANHVLIDVGELPQNVGHRLWERNVRVKFNFPKPLDRHLLVTCGSPDLMKKFYEEFKKVWAG